MGVKHLTRESRFYIEQQVGKNISLSEIARDLGVHRSTISREIKRNTAPDFQGLYCYIIAQTIADKKRSEASRDNKFSELTDEVKSYIHDRLQVHTSPNVIAGEMRRKLN